MSTSLKGLSRAVGPTSASTGFDAKDDPLGVALQSRAQQNRFQYQLQNPMSMTAGPLPDPRWDSYFQAVHEAAGGKPVDYAGSGGEDLGFDTNNGTMGAGTEVYGPRGLRMFDADTTTSLKGLKRGGGYAGG